MATTRSFSSMLNDFLANDLLREELIDRSYVLQKVEKDDTWLGGSLIVPFKGAGASSVTFGSLAAANDIAESVYVRGEVTTQPEAWGTLIFNHRDIMEHNKLSEQNFLKLLETDLPDFMDYFKNVISTALLGGTWFSKITANNASASSGVITVDRPDKFVIGQKISVDDDDSSPQTGYVTAININTSEITVKNARSSGSVVDLSTYTVAQNAKVYHDGSQSAGFSSMRGALLPASNTGVSGAGDSTLYGQTKTAYPYLQAIGVDASTLAVTRVNIVDTIFNAYVKICKLGKGSPTEVLMSYTNFGYCLAVFSTTKDAFNVNVGSTKTSMYGWKTLEVGGLKGTLNLVAVQECDDDIILFIDWRAWKFYSNGFFRKRQSPDGIEYFEQRATSGYSYIVDVCLFGDLVCLRPSYCGILYNLAIT